MPRLEDKLARRRAANRLPLGCRRSGFTLIEVLVVLAVIGILVALLVPAVQHARESARMTECRNRLHQLGLALHNYESSHNVFPPSFVRQEDGNPPPPPVPFAPLRYRSRWTGFHLLLPYVDYKALFDRYDFNQSWLSSLTDPSDISCWPLNQTVVPTYICPSAWHEEMAIGGTSGGSGNPDFIITPQGTLQMQGTPGAGAHWMAGAPADYSFCHGADIIRAIPGVAGSCPGGVLHYWRKWPARTRGAFGYNSDCRLRDVTDGGSNTFLLGEKAGGLLYYQGWNASFPRLGVEYPWAMAAVAYFAPTGNESIPGSYWIAGPFAVTQDIRLPNCPTDFALGQPYPMNPFPREVPFTSDERPFYSFQSAHSGGAYFLFADGHAQFLSEDIDQNVYEALSTISGRESVGTGDY